MSQGKLLRSIQESRNCLDCSRSSKCFQKLIPEELEFINQNKTHLLYQKGETICKQGAYSSYVSYISEGLVKLYLEGPGQSYINLKILKTSDYIGLSSIYGDSIYYYSTITLADSVVCLIEKASFKKLLLTNGNFASEIVRWYCENEKYLFDKIHSLGHKQIHGRLADALIHLCNIELEEANVFSFLSRKDIAGFAGISTESAVRILTEFKNDGIIEINGRQITILNRELLKEISHRG